MTDQYKLIIFDLGNTIIRFDHNISAKRLAERFGLDQKRIYDTFFDSEVTQRFGRGEITPREFYSAVQGLLKISLPYKEFVDIWSDVFWQDTESCDLARMLKTRYKLCLMSNINKTHFEHIKREFEIIKIFDYLALSYIVGVMKPDIRIFEYVRDESGVDFRDMLYIDDREDLVKEASSFGIESIKFEGAKSLERWLLEQKVL